MLAFLFDRNCFEGTLGRFLEGEGEGKGGLQGVMAVLKGEVEGEVKAEFAFEMVKKMLMAFEVNKHPHKVIKLLLILDKLVDDNLFCEEISKLTLLPFEVAKPLADSNPNSLRALRLYWKIVKDRAVMVRDRSHIFHEKRSQRMQHLHRAKVQTIVAQLTAMQGFFDAIFELVYYLQAPVSKEGKGEGGAIVEHIVLHLLHKLLGLYSCQMMANKFLIHRLKELTAPDLQRFKRTIAKFRENCNRFILFIKAHQGAKGFEHVHFEEIKVQANETLSRFVDEYLNSMQTESLKVQFSSLPATFGRIVVEKKSHNAKISFHPRLPFKSTDPKRENQEGNPFLNWHNNYSHQFPQKEIMTVDLILQIKLEDSLGNNDPEPCLEAASRCSYDNRSTNITSNYEVSLSSRMEYSINVLQRVEFENTYSRLQPKWNLP